MKKSILFLIFCISCIFVQGASIKVYFGTSEKGIYLSIFDTETGKLGKPELVAEIDAPGFLALHPDKQKLYAVGRIEKQAVVSGYSIQEGGLLKQFTQSQSKGGGSAHISVHPSGRFLLTAQYGNGSVTLFPLEDDGTLGNGNITMHKGGSNVVPQRQSNPHPHWCGYSPDGRFAFVPDLGMDKIMIYRVNLDKPEILEHGFASTVPGGGARHMRFSLDGDYIFCLNELTLSVTTFSYNFETGTTHQLTTVPTLSEEVKAREEFNSAAEILVHPSGRFVYCSNRGHDSVTSFSADKSTGELTGIEVEPIRGAWPRNINMDSSGEWLLAAGAHSNTISVFEIDQSTGELTYIKNSIINVPRPICILFAE
jgi:6-phosphogluconolactonase